MKLVAAIGSSPSGDMPDALGSLLSLEMQSSGLRTDGLIDVTGGTTAGCTLALDEGGDLVNGVADMGIVEHLTPDKVSAMHDVLFLWSFSPLKRSWIYALLWLYQNGFLGMRALC